MKTVVLILLEIMFEDYVWIFEKKRTYYRLVRKTYYVKEKKRTPYGQNIFLNDAIYCELMR